MLLLGLLLLAAIAAFTGLLISDNLSGGPQYSVSILGNHFVTLNVLGVFLAGLALALLFGLVWWITALRVRSHRSLRTRPGQPLGRAAGPPDAVAGAPRTVHRGPFRRQHPV